MKHVMLEPAELRKLQGNLHAHMKHVTNPTVIAREMQTKLPPRKLPN